jgi:hypothetical protein
MIYDMEMLYEKLQKFWCGKLYPVIYQKNYENKNIFIIGFKNMFTISW